MRRKLFVFLILLVWISAFVISIASSQSNRQNRRDRFRHNGVIEDEDRPASGRSDATEAPTGFDNLTNGFTDQGSPFEELNEDNIVALRSFNDNRFIFEEVEKIQDGLGPTYNAQSCRECHQNIVSGGASQVTVLRSGHTQKGVFFESQGGSLIQSRAIDPLIMEYVVAVDDIRAFRISPGALGDGFVEAIANDTLLQIR